MCRFVLALIWCWTALPLSALDPARPLPALARHSWRSEDGLLRDTVTALLESRDGFLWIGTEAGLVRFDGATFEPFSHTNVPGFVHTSVQCLAEDAGGALWIGTSEPGLYRFQSGQVRAFGPEDGLPGQPIRHLLRDRGGTLWAAPVEGPLLRFDGARFQALPSDASHLRIRSLVEDGGGTLWVGTAGSGLWRLRAGRLVLAALTSSEISALGVGPEDTLWVGTRSQGLLVLSEGRLEAPAWARSLPARPISALLADRQGGLWIGFEQAGLFRRRGGGRIEPPPDLPGSRGTPLSLLEDRSGALWSGTEDRGLKVLYPVPFQTVPSAGTDTEASVRMVCQDTEGGVWCLTADHALGLVRQGRTERISPGGPLGAPPSAIWPRRAGGLWVGSQNGELFILEGGRFRPAPWPQPYASEAILSLYEDAQHTLWAAASRRGLVKLVPGSAPVLFPTIQGVLAMVGGPSGALYLASRTQGLGLLESSQVRWLGPAEGLGSTGVLSLHLDPEEGLWLGTPNGLRRYQGGVFQRFSTPAGPLTMAIHSILEDATHRLWLGTGQGVFRVPRAALQGSLQAAGPIPVLAFDHHDGLPSRETSSAAQPAAWLTREGDLYFPTSRGLARTGGDPLPGVGTPLHIHFLKAESDETVLPETSPILVPPGTHRFEVYYTATALTRADKVRFRYRLEGLERTWNEVGDRRFSAYSNLPPGTYRFVVQAWRLDEDGPPQERAIPVLVLPYLHQRPLFWVLCAFGGLAFGAWLLRLRLQQVEARSAVLSERNRMAREIHDHLAQGFTGVLLQLEAAEAKLSRMQGDPEPVLTRLEHARNLAASSLLEARRSVLALHPRKAEGADLLGALRSLSDRLLAGTDIQVELALSGEPRPLRERVEEELLRMAQELFTNALRHGRARWVRVVLQFEKREVRLSVEDDGYGFDPAADAAGYGMRSIRASIKQLRGRLDIDSSQGLGSRVTITLPTWRWRP